jgi:uncharacterized Fe-S cluster protein YjdI
MVETWLLVGTLLKKKKKETTGQNFAFNLKKKIPPTTKVCVLFDLFFSLSCVQFPYIFPSAVNNVIKEIKTRIHSCPKH